MVSVLVQQNILLSPVPKGWRLPDSSSYTSGNCAWRGLTVGAQNINGFECATLLGKGLHSDKCPHLPDEEPKTQSKRVATKDLFVTPFCLPFLLP